MLGGVEYSVGQVNTRGRSNLSLLGGFSSSVDGNSLQCCLIAIHTKSVDVVLHSISKRASAVCQRGDLQLLHQLERDISVHLWP